MSGSRAVRNLAVAVSLLPLLAACGTASDPADGGTASAGGGKTAAGSSGQLDVPADASADIKEDYLIQNALASCMKKQGFLYTPVVPVDPADSWTTGGADYELTRKYRQKYGFGIYADIVYPDDPQARGGAVSLDDVADTANGEYVASLSAAQKAAYDKAMGVPGREAKATGVLPAGCHRSATEEVYGSASTREIGARTTARDKANGQALNGDPKLVALAQSYASCLRGHGIPVTTTQPTDIHEMVKLQALRAAPLGADSGDLNADGTPAETIGKDEALPLLTRDVRLATQDLECGREFRAAYFPKFFKAPTSGGGGAG
ncbi:hypothetical protein ADL00_27995 [Streptomyces sp. AS58]|uniref:hypothetical protein n=1 Tax=Streptomyces TaxID=1883 RepID=UPI0006C1C3F2|nr:hypothetical protein [Streptomyces sp. AS58]KOV56020.1 hypothetical protein ADL00_27995 [Streptomyces sp. AS58]